MPKQPNSLMRCDSFECYPMTASSQRRKRGVPILYRCSDPIFASTRCNFKRPDLAIVTVGLVLINLWRVTRLAASRDYFATKATISCYLQVEVETGVDLL